MNTLQFNSRGRRYRKNGTILLLSLPLLLLYFSCRKDNGESRGEVLVGHVIERGSNYPISGAQVLLLGSTTNKHGQHVEYVISQTETNRDGEYILDFPKVSAVYYTIAHTADHYPKDLIDPGETRVRSQTRIHDIYLTRKTKTIFRVKNESGANAYINVVTPRQTAQGLKHPELDTTFSLLMNAYDSNSVRIDNEQGSKAYPSYFKIYVGYNNTQDTFLYTY